MFRRYAFAALTFAAVACSSDSSDNSSDNKDAAVAATDAAVATPVVPGKATNVGEPCTAASACTGAGTTECLTKESLPLGAGTITYAGGYCSATCTDNSECTGTSGASTGECPFGNLVKQASALGPAASGLLGGISVCMKPCTADTDCRSPGYKCDTVASQLPMNSMIPSGLLTGFLPSTKYCLSTDIEIPDAGVVATDGGTTTDGGATDAGVSDAATGDAGTSDASTGDAAADAGDAA